jgi:hypothetical protein
MNMFKKVKAKNIKEYLEKIEEPRKKDILFLHDFIQKVSSLYTPHFTYNMLGYGVFKYKNYKNELIDWPIIALANQKNYISIYACSLENGQYLAEKYKDKLGKVNTGKSCIRFKKLDDLNLKVLNELLLKASKNPGLTK